MCDLLYEIGNWVGNFQIMRHFELWCLILNLTLNLLKRLQKYNSKKPVLELEGRKGPSTCKPFKVSDTYDIKTWWNNRGVQNRLLDSVGEGEGGMFQENSIKTCILSWVKQITSPGWMHETSARTWCTGKTQREWVEREVGRDIGMGNTCKSMADSCQCMTKTTTIL